MGCRGVAGVPGHLGVEQTETRELRFCAHCTSVRFTQGDSP
ncbi:hypothetical protein RGUI_1309 [Rhodovulum sp. P5]|nr:hypothetical protein RGUI_1309 [Rhodovulum sp. P5]